MMNIKTLNFPKINYLLFHVLFFIFTISFVLPGSAPAATDVRRSMVKIYCVQNEPDYENPWNMKGPVAFSGSGCIIEGSRVLTNAHVVSNHTFIQVRRNGQSQKHEAKIIAISHDADLALLGVDDPAFFEGVTPLKFGSLPEIEQDVVVCGFPEGGDSLSTTKGVISRIESQPYVHSWIELLAGQLDAAINPGNSGGPVMVGDRIVGVVMQALTNSQNIGYMIPVPVIEHFLTDMEDGRYDGFPEDGIVIQPLENASLKKMHGLNEEQSGAVVSSVTSGSPARGLIFPGDVLLSVDGHRIADDCTVEFRPNERTDCDFYIKQHQIGEEVVYKILRRGEELSVRLMLDKPWGKNMLVPTARYSVQPTYYIYGGLVFCPLTLNYLLTPDGNPSGESPYDLLPYFNEVENFQEGEEVVIIIKVLAGNFNNGYENLVNSRIMTVNEKEILNLQQLIHFMETDTEKEFMVFQTLNDKTIVIDRKMAEAAHNKILSIYRIAEDRSADLKTIASNDKAETKEISAIRSAEAVALNR
jgi:S1-C subfamily serine protease